MVKTTFQQKNSTFHIIAFRDREDGWAKSEYERMYGSGKCRTTRTIITLPR